MNPRAKHKFSAKPTSIDNIRFHSKAEAKFYKELKLQHLAGEVIGFLMQVPLHFKCGTTYKLDFLVFYSDGTCKGIEVKGFSTEAFRIKEKLIASEYAWLDYEIYKV